MEVLWLVEGRGAIELLMEAVSGRTMQHSLNETTQSVPFNLSQCVRISLLNVLHYTIR
jgi:hypothetical protein